MNNQHITTKYLMETLTNAGYKVRKGTDSYGKRIDIFYGLVYVGVVRVDKMYCFKISAYLNDEYRERLFNILCDYAKTPIDAREPRAYKLKILDTSLYLIHISEYETTVTTNKKAAKAYDDAGVYDANVLAEKQGFALRAEVMNVTD